MVSLNVPDQELQLTLVAGLQEFPKEAADQIIDLLFQTYSYYVDRPSRKAVQKCLQANALYPPCTSRLFELYEKECSKPGLAPSNAFVLVEWGSVMIQHAAHQGMSNFEKYGLKILQAHARVLELVLSTGLHSKTSVHTSAIINTRRALRKLIRGVGASAITSVVENLTAKGQPLGLKSANLLGILAGICARLKDGVALLAKCKEHYYAYYLREILGSRTLMPKHLASAFNEFFKSFITIEDLQKHLVPSLEKSLLRAPEIVLNDLMSPLFQSIPQDVDVANILANNLSPPLFAALKSSNTSVRNGAISAFDLLIAHSRDQKALGKIVDDLLLPMSTSKMAADHRALYAQVLAMMPAIPTKSRAICETLCNVLIKETNENAVGSEITILLRQFRSLAEVDQTVMKTVTRTCVTGLEDKRLGVRRQWILGIGELLWKNCCEETAEIVERGHVDKVEAECLPHFLRIAEEAIRNPIAAGSSGLAVGPLVAICLCKKILDFGSEMLKSTVRKAKLVDRILSTDPKSATLLNPRVYAKLSEADSTWQVRALIVSASESQSSPEGDLDIAWSQAMIYLIASDDHSRLRKMAMDALTVKYLENRADIARITIKGLWLWYRNVEAGKKDTAAAMAKTGTRRLHFVVRSICHTSGQDQLRQKGSGSEVMEKQLINMLVLCRPEVMPHVHWIEMCLRVGEDPGLIAKKNPKECLEKIRFHLSAQDDIDVSSNISLAAYNAAAELAFVAPDAIIPLLLDQIDRDLPVDEVLSCGPTEVAIARTPPGTVFIDVLSSQNQKYTVDKNSKDYDTMKWEEEMRSQIAKKKGQEKKLTADEKARVNAQLVKEAEIRQQVHTLQGTLRNGIGYMHALAIGPPTEAIMWLGPSLQALTVVIEAGAGRLVGDAANEAYLACSNFVSPRLGILKQFLGLATLRLLGSAVPPDLEQEPLKGLTARPNIVQLTKAW